MDQHEQFKLLKEEVLINYADYTNAVRNLSLDDLGTLNIRLLSIDKYNKAVASDMAYRDFIRQYYNEINAKDK